MADPNVLCARCGWRKSTHHLVNYADGPHVGEAFLICPTAVFDETDGPKAHANAVAEEMKKPK